VSAKVTSKSAVQIILRRCRGRKTNPLARGASTLAADDETRVQVWNKSDGTEEEKST